MAAITQERLSSNSIVMIEFEFAKTTPPQGIPGKYLIKYKTDDDKYKLQETKWNGSTFAALKTKRVISWFSLLEPKTKVDESNIETKESE